MNFSDEFAYKGPVVKKTTANRGKGTESELSKAFDKLKGESISFDYERIPDAYSSRGGISTPRTGDYILFYRGATLIVEAKETKNLKALPADKFSTDSRARLRRRERAGIHCIVVVFQSVLNVYRVIELSEFDTRATGSFELTCYPALTLQDTLISCLQFLTMPTSVQTEVPELPQVQS